MINNIVSVLKFAVPMVVAGIFEEQFQEVLKIRRYFLKPNQAEYKEFLLQNFDKVKRDFPDYAERWRSFSNFPNFTDPFLAVAIIGLKVFTTHFSMYSVLYKHTQNFNIRNRWLFQVFIWSPVLIKGIEILSELTEIDFVNKKIQQINNIFLEIHSVITFVFINSQENFSKGDLKECFYDGQFIMGMYLLQQTLSHFDGSSSAPKTDPRDWARNKYFQIACLRDKFDKEFDDEKKKQIKKELNSYFLLILQEIRINKILNGQQAAIFKKCIENNFLTFSEDSPEVILPSDFVWEG